MKNFVIERFLIVKMWAKIGNHCAPNSLTCQICPWMGTTNYEGGAESKSSHFFRRKSAVILAKEFVPPYNCFTAKFASAGQVEFPLCLES